MSTWDRLLQSMTAQQRLEAAVLRIQTNFRARREEKAKRRMKLLRDRRGRTASVRIEERLRADAARARD
eukprot:11302276-Ditylum_brightwellii.AAC.1